MAGIASQPSSTELHPVAHFNSRLHFQLLKDTDTKTQEAECTVTGSNESKTVTIYNTKTEDSSIRWNLATIVNDMFVDLSKLFNSIGGSSALTGNRTLFTLSAVFTDYVEQSDLTLDEGTSATSTTITCLIAAVESLDDYYSNGALRFLTMKTKGRVGSASSEYLTIYGDGSESCRVAFYDANGDYMEDEDITYSATAGNLTHFPIGTANMTVPNGAKSYRVNLRDPSTIQTLKYNIVSCDLHYLHFVNRFGQIDSIGFDRLEHRASVSSDIYSQPIQTFPIENGFQYLRTNIQASQTYTATAYKLSFEEMQWLTDLLNTPFAMWEVNGEYISIQILDSETPNYSDRKNDFVFSIQFRLSNPIGAID